MLDAILAFTAAEHQRHPWLVPGLLISGSAALGTGLTDLIAWIGSHLWIVVAASAPLMLTSAMILLGLRGER